jgi:hypothetical protein
MFNESVLQLLPKGWMYNNAIAHLVEEYIAHSKIVVLNSRGEATIYNEDKGHWKGGVWFSNHTYSYFRTEYKKNREYYGTDYSSDYGYKSNTDGTWWVGNKHRRYVLNGVVQTTGVSGILEQYDDILKKWRPYNIHIANYVEGKETEVKEKDHSDVGAKSTPSTTLGVVGKVIPMIGYDKSKEVCDTMFECDWCNGIKTEDEVQVVAVNGKRSLMCKLCKAELGHIEGVVVLNYADKEEVAQSSASTRQ